MKGIRKYFGVMLMTGLCSLFLPGGNLKTAQAASLPTEDEITAYKAEGTWEERQEYVKALGYDRVSPQLIQEAVRRESGVDAMSNVPSDWEEMPTEGNVKILAVQVEFQDYTFESSTIYPEDIYYQMFNGGALPEQIQYPYDSLSSYYKRSSYGKLNLSSGQVYRCRLSKNRAEYEGYATGEQELVKEVLQLLDDQIDYSDYDSNGDGCVDGISINFAGENSGWGSTWWSHKYRLQDQEFSLDGMNFSGYLYLMTDCSEGDYTYGTQTLIHETGHMLGLPDYYAAQGNDSTAIATVDMMKDNTGDHNGFSKWLLGWIPEENIQRVTKEDGEQVISLDPIASETLSNKKMIAVVAPEDTSLYSEYFVVQYDEKINNNQSAWYGDSTGYRIYHVDAELNYEGSNFRYDNMYSSEPRLIRALNKNNFETATVWMYETGDRLAPETDESTWFYGNTPAANTGIIFDDFETGDSATFRVSFEQREPDDGKLELTLSEGSNELDNIAYITINSNRKLFYTEEQSSPGIYLEANGEQYPLSMNIQKGNKDIVLTYSGDDKILKPNTEYTLVIPQKTFLTEGNVYNKEWRGTVKTADFPAAEKIIVSENNSFERSELIASGDGRAMIAKHMYQEDDENYHFVISMIDQAGNVIDQEVKLPRPQDAYIDSINGTACYDGNIVLSLWTYSQHTLLYRLDKDGNYLSGPVDVPVKLQIFPSGSGVKGTEKDSGEPAGAPVETGDVNESWESWMSVYTIDFENETAVRSVESGFKTFMISMDQNSYMVAKRNPSEWYYEFVIYDNNDNKISDILKLPEDYLYGTVLSAVKNDNGYRIFYSYDDGNKVTLRSALYNENGTLMDDRECLTALVGDNLSKDIKWQVCKGEWGYLLISENYEPGRTCYFLDKEANYLSRMTLSGLMNNGVAAGNRFVYAWNALIDSEENMVCVITEPLIKEPVEPSKPEEPAKPKETSGSVKNQNNHVPRTGDEANPGWFLLMIMLSGAMIFSCTLKRRR